MSEPTKCAIEECPDPATRRGWCATHYHRWKRHGDPRAGRRRQTPSRDLRTFAEFAAMSADDECIPWPGQPVGGGYGTLAVDGVQTAAHRHILTLATGEDPPDGHFAIHAPVVCHNRRCVNPRHLRWGTPKDNHTDMAADGTMMRGEGHGSSKLTECDVRAIRTDGRPASVIAADYGVSPRAIGCILERSTWTHVD